MVYYRPVTLDDYEALRQLLQACSCEGSLLEESRLRRLIDNADRTVGAFDEGAMVGFASALCDEASVGVVGALCVAPEHRRQGIGSELASQLIEDSPEINWVLLAGSAPADFWARQGFNPAAQAMERRRAR